MACILSALIGTFAFTAESPDSIEPWDVTSQESIFSTNWNFSAGPEFPGATGEMRFSSAEQCGELAFDFSSGGNYVAAYVHGPNRDLSSLCISVNNPHGNRLTFRYTDSASTTFQKSFNTPPQGWQDYEIRLTPDASHWGGPEDGVLRPPIKQFGILVENSGQATTGTIQFRDLSLIKVAHTQPTGKVDYLVTDFKTGWSAGESAAWSDRQLRYDFSQGHSEARIHCGSISLPGHPSLLRLRVDSDGSGHEIVARCASHFQIFERVLGTLEINGSMTFSATMEGMTGWTHFGGENDGIVRLPVRILDLAIRKKGTVSSGIITLKDFHVETVASPERAISLISEALLSENERCILRLSAVSLRDRVIGNLAITLIDSSGISFQQKTIPIDWHGSGKFQLPEQSFRLGKRPFAEIQCELMTDDGITYRASTTVNVLPEPVKNAQSADSPFGMGLYLYRYASTPEGYADMEAAARTAARAGIAWSREEFGWARIQPERDRYEWDYYDRMIETASRHGIRIYGLISYWSSWTQPFTDEGIADYCNYARALVSRYKDHIKHWEVWNEPNIFFWDGPKPVYAKILREACHAIKEADPEAQVLGCSTAGIDIPFIQDVLSRGGLFDILTIHPYRMSLQDEVFIKELQATRDMVKKPVWITEMGWPTELGGVTERQQAGLVSRVYVDSVASGSVGNVSWYDFRNDGIDPFYNEYNFGVVRRDLSPKAGYLALANAVRHLGPFVNSRPEPLSHKPSGVIGFSFSSSRENLAVLWSEDTTRFVALEMEGRIRTARDFIGGDIRLIRRRNQTFLVLLPDEPVFLSGPGFKITHVIEALQYFIQPANVKAGDAVTIELNPVESCGNVQVRIPGAKQEDHRVQFQIPSSRQHSTFERIADLRIGSSSLKLPIRISVSPSVIRL